MTGSVEIMFAFFLDLAIGDPRRLPHPVRIIGKAISGAERVLRRFFTTAPGERRAGVLLVLSVVLPAYFITDGIVRLLDHASGRFWTMLGAIIIVYLTATTIAARELVRSARLVITSVENRDLESARRQVSMIVGRDTRELPEKGVLKATIETLAENLSDGVVAPLLYLALGGLPLAVAYKAVNTLDSMVGYKNDRYRHFGRAAAGLDDFANYVPARITGLLIVAAAFLVEFARAFKPPRAIMNPGGERNEKNRAARRSWNVMIRDGGKHTSPNSGVPEAAMAGALGVRLGGPSTYGGVPVDKPYIGDEERDDYLPASRDAMTLVKVSSALAAAGAITLSALRGLQ